MLFFDVFTVVVFINLFIAMVGMFVILSPILYNSEYRRSLTWFGTIVSIYGMLTAVLTCVTIGMWTYGLSQLSGGL